MKSYYLDKYDTFVRYFDIAGDGSGQPPRVFVSGLSTPSTAGLLNIALHPLLRSRRTLMIDYIGSGFSDSSADFDHTMPAHAAYIAEILDHEGITASEFIGHSMGGTVGIYLALQRPDLVSRLVVAEGNIAPGGGPGTRYITGFKIEEWVRQEHPAYMQRLQKSARSGDKRAAMVAGAWAASDPTGIYKQSRSLVELPRDFTRQFLDLSMPVTFIYGDANLPENNNGEIWPDSPDPAQLQDNGIRVGVVQNSGHMMMVDNPDGFAEVVANALS